MQTFAGKVIRGSRRAAMLGYPTINIALSDQKISGVFAAQVTIDGVIRIAAAFADPARGMLEAHILDISEDYYDKEAEIELVKKIRETAVFTDDESLRAAIETDIAIVREYFKN